MGQALDTSLALAPCSDGRVDGDRRSNRRPRRDGHARSPGSCTDATLSGKGMPWCKEQATARNP